MQLRQLYTEILNSILRHSKTDQSACLRRTISWLEKSDSIYRHCCRQPFITRVVDYQIKIRQNALVRTLVVVAAQIPLEQTVEQCFEEGPS